MATAGQRESAKILQFPTKARPAGGNGRYEQARFAAEAAMAPRVAKVAVGSGWYHEAAIQEAEQAAKR